MSDLRTLLHAAAPAPAAPLDLQSIHRRAARRGWRRVAAWVGALTAVLASLGVAQNVVVTTTRPERVTVTTVAPGDAVRSGDVAPVAVAQAPRIAAPATARRTVTTARGGSGDTGRTPEAPAGTDERPPARAKCSVDAAALPVGQARRCAFVATAEGGAGMIFDGNYWSADPELQPVRGEVFVTRNGQRTRAWTTEECGNEVGAGDAGAFVGSCDGRKMIVPGDLVEVVLLKKTEFSYRVVLGAGEGWAGMS